MQSIDDTTYKKYFSLRRKKSKWSEKNKALVQRLEEKEPGLPASTKAMPSLHSFWAMFSLSSREKLMPSPWATLEENLAMIRYTVSFLKEQGRMVIFDAEHFFDGYRSHPDYARQAVLAAREAGADRVVLCDTNGGTFPLIAGWG